MATETTETQWIRMREALHSEVRRVVDALRSVRNPRAAAVGDWNLADVATHLSQVWVGVLALARGGLAGHGELLPGVTPAGDSLVCDIWELGDVTAAAVRAEPERDPSVLADRIEARAAEFLHECTSLSPEEPRPWLVEGTTVNAVTLTGHLLSETIMHGYDIARADGRPWRIEPSHAAMVLTRFLVPAIQTLDSRALVNKDKAAGLRVTYELRIRGTDDRFHFVFRDGTLRVEQPSSRRVDCRISVDPAAFLMLVWDRGNQWKALLRGQLTPWGRKPWLAARLRSSLRNP